MVERVNRTATSKEIIFYHAPEEVSRPLIFGAFDRELKHEGKNKSRNTKAAESEKDAC